MPGYTREEWERILDKLEKVHGPDLRHMTPEEARQQKEEGESFLMAICGEGNDADERPTASSQAPGYAYPSGAFEMPDAQFLEGCGIADDAGGPKNAAAAPREA
jgi:hypothetical protein